MKVSVELTPAEIKAMRIATRQKRKGEAIRLLALEALKLKKRHALSDKILAGVWAVDFPDVGSLRKDRTAW